MALKIFLSYVSLRKTETVLNKIACLELKKIPGEESIVVSLSGNLFFNFACALCALLGNLHQTQTHAVK